MNRTVVVIFFTLFTAIIVMTVSCGTSPSNVKTVIQEKEIQARNYIFPAEGSVPNVPPEVRSADFWIEQAEEPDKVLLTPFQIELYNEHRIEEKKLTVDIMDLPDRINGRRIKKFMSENARYLSRVQLYVTGTIPLEKLERQRIIANMDTAGVPDVITPKYGVVLRWFMGRNWPSDILLMSSPDAVEFDAGVTASMDIGEPVVLLHSSKDGRWVYIQGSRFQCWAPANAVAFGTKRQVEDFVNIEEPYVVAIAPRVSVWSPPEGPSAIASIPMGTKWAVATVGRDYYGIYIPGRGPNGDLELHRGYVKRNDEIADDYLPYTQRNVYEQAFKMLDYRYGWGGMYQDSDCSAFVLMVFRSFGFELPRNSADQAMASRGIYEVEGMSESMKRKTLANCPGGITLTRMKGHIMIYLGMYEDKPYAIHNFWSWREEGDDVHDNVFRVARVDVSDYTLGEGSGRSNFLDRLTHITLLGNYAFK